ncbi:unnamed protein product [Rotaria sordida]|uniref:Uncharacterized protein n=1 Tax=Rotaria sordida TaxID=392033 RepID=A0A818PV02_9BILA|nr:unnamed protein product [Rotaria sordida]
MRSQLIVLLVVGLVASSYAYHLSDAKKRSIETEPRLFSILTDFYAQVVYPPLNHIVQNMALLSAQVLAGIAQTGIPAPGGRTIHLSNVELRDFIDDLWNNAVKPPLQNAIQGLSLMAAQALAGIGVNGINLSNLFGKRDLNAEEARFIDDLIDKVAGIFTQVFQKPIENAVSSGALMLAQVLAGIGTNGVNLSNIFGKRDLNAEEARFLQSLFGAFETVFNEVLQKPLENAVSSGALMLAQVLAGIGTNGVNLSSLFGKRDLSELASRQAEIRGFFDTLGNGLLNGLQSVWTNIVQGPIEQALQSGALMAAQVLAGIGTNGIDLGKRQLNNDARGPIIDDLVGHATGLYTNQVKPVVENALNSAILHLAGILANFSQSGIGRR